MNIITKDRVIDDNFKKQIDSNSIFICEKHFSEDQLYIYNHKKELKEGALPTLNLPVKSIVNKQSSINERSTSSISKRENFLVSSTLSIAAPHKCYKDFNDFVTRINNLKLPKWSIIHKENSLTTIVFQGEYLVPKFQIFVDCSLGYTLRVFGWLIPIDHILYTNYRRRFFKITLSNFITFLENLSLCPGIDLLSNSMSSAIKHIIQKKKFL